MNAVTHLELQFVKSIPRELDPGVLYISMEYCTMLHLCACGCGRKVVTPLSPKDWNLTFNGKAITVKPSIGSWSLPCQSHYLIRYNKIVWADQWSDEQIKRGREADLARKRGYLAANADKRPALSFELEYKSISSNWLQRILHWMRGKLR